MAPRAPGVHTHEEWKGMAQPVGLVVEPVVLNRLGIFPESSTTVLADWQQRLEQLLEDQPVGDQWLSVAPSFELFCQEVLAWEPGDLRKPEELAAPVAVTLDDYDEVLHPDWVVPEPSQGDGPLKAQLLVQELPLGTPFDALPKGADGRRSWEATPQQRLERLLKESEHPIGLLWNGVALRLVYAPRGESSGHLTFPLEPMTTVDGRPMLAALQMLLGPDRLFEGGASNTRLRPLMEQSRKEQNEVSTRLAEQVLEALWILLRGFDAAGLEVEDPSHIYGGLITVLLRLVFLLYAEDEELMPTDSLYGQHYSVGGLAQRLRQDRTDYQNAMEGRRGAWATLLSLFRLVYDGGGSTEAYLPARHGDLFDPDTYAFLEGRTADTSYTDGPLTSVPAISDDVVEQVLTKLLLLDGQILSYRALDVEQIGSVYEGIMGFMVEKATGPSVGITHRPQRQKITITVVVNAEELLAQPASKREKWLKDAAGVDLKLGDKVNKGLKTATTAEDLCHALDKRLSKHTPRGGFQSGSLILQPTEERRRSGSHYTPRSLTEPIVAEALRPWLEGCNGKPTAEQVLALKLCDPAMGSGAFLVAVCRFLARWLVAAWEDPEGPGFPPEFRKEWDKDLYARRLIAQRCLYGVDKNPFAANLAKLSLWLVTLSKDLPFTFVDHALKSGDSLVGCSMKEIQAATSELQLVFLNEQNQIFTQMGSVRSKTFGDDNHSDEGYDHKKELLEQQIKATEGLRQTGDLIVSAFFDAPNPKERADKQKVYLAMLSGAFNDEELENSIQEICDQLTLGERGIKPFHWQLEFPEVFERESSGFDVFVGNPPFAGNNTFTKLYPKKILEYFKDMYPGAGGQCDFSAYFFRRCFSLGAPRSTMCFISTSSICEGDTRQGGLEQICKSGGQIYFAQKRRSWPGIAAVNISTTCISRGFSHEKVLIDGRPASSISSFLLPFGPNETPRKLPTNKNISFNGSKPYAQGFVIEDKDDADDSSPGTTIPSEVIARIVRQSPHSAEVVFPYLGGDEINGSPTHEGKRRVIDFGIEELDVVKESHPDLLRLIELKVKPERLTKAKDVAAYPWWIHWRPKRDLYSILARIPSCLCITRHTEYLGFARVPTKSVFNEALIVIPSASVALFGILQSSIHLAWAQIFSSSLGAGYRYTPTDCLENFPVPESMLDDNAQIAIDDPESIRSSGLAQASQHYLDTRERICIRTGQGLTKFYGRISNPASHDDKDTRAFLVALRQLDIEVAKIYGIPVRLRHGYYLRWESLTDSLDQLSSEELYDTDEIFFENPLEALDFESRLALGQSLPWEYGPDLESRLTIVDYLVRLHADILKLAESSGWLRRDHVVRARQNSQVEVQAKEFQMGLGL